MTHRSELEADWERATKAQPSNESNPWSKIGSMQPLPLVTRAAYVDGFRIRLAFSDGLEAVVDFDDWLTGPVFELLRDIEEFKRFFIEAGAISWPNGADIAPEALHERASATTAA